MAKVKEKIMVRDTIQRDILDELDNRTLDEVIQYFDALKETPRYTDIKLETDWGYEYTHLALTGSRLETDKEYEYRMVREERVRQIEKDRKIEKEIKDRKEYERLKKKYGDE